MKLEKLYDLYLDEIKDLYSAEEQIVKALPKVIEKTSSTELRSALQKHFEETKTHVTRLEKVLEMHDQKPEKQKCRGMQGILEEGEQMLKKDATPNVRDAAIISACQRVEHYEIAAYGTVRTYATQLGLERAAAVLQETLDEEAAADKKLTEVASTRVNVEATRTA